MCALHLSICQTWTKSMHISVLPWNLLQIIINMSIYTRKNLHIPTYRKRKYKFLQTESGIYYYNRFHLWHQDIFCTDHFPTNDYVYMMRWRNGCVELICSSLTLLPPFYSFLDCHRPSAWGDSQWADGFPLGRDPTWGSALLLLGDAVGRRKTQWEKEWVNWWIII